MTGIGYGPPEPFKGRLTIAYQVVKRLFDCPLGRLIDPPARNKPKQRNWPTGRTEESLGYLVHDRLEVMKRAGFHHGGPLVDAIKDCLAASLRFESPFPQQEVARQRRRLDSAKALSEALRKHLPVLLDDQAWIGLIPDGKGRDASWWLEVTHAGIRREIAELSDALARERLMRELAAGMDPALIPESKEFGGEWAGWSAARRNAMVRFASDYAARKQMMRIEADLRRTEGKTPSRSRLERARKEAGIKPAQLRRADAAMKARIHENDFVAGLAKLDEAKSLIEPLMNLIAQPVLAFQVASAAASDQKGRRRDAILTWPLFVEFAIALIQEVAPGDSRPDRSIVFENLIDFLIQPDMPKQLGLPASIKHRDASSRCRHWMHARRSGSARVPAGSLSLLRAYLGDTPTKEGNAVFCRVHGAWEEIVNSLKPTA